MRRWTRSDLEGAHLVWLLRLTFAGRDWLFSTEAITAYAADGTPHQHDGGLDDIEAEFAMQGIGADPVQRSVPISILWPEDHPIAALIEAGADLGAARGELSLWNVDQDYESRRIYLVGRATRPRYGSPLAPVEFDLAEYEWTGGTLVPSPAAVVTADTWSRAPEGSLGEIYPEVVGIPGQYQRVPSQTTSGTPAPIVDFLASNVVAVLLAGHHVDATDVVIFDGTTSEVFSVLNTTDDLGAEVAVAAITGASTISTTAEKYWAGWRASGGGGRMDTDGNLLQGACDVIVFYAEASGRKIDKEAWRRVAPEINQIKIGGYWRERLDPWEWLTDHVIPLLPLEMASGPNGLYPIMHRYAATAADAIEHIHVGDGLDAEMVTWPTYSRITEVVNRFTIEYAFRARTGKPRRTLTIDGDPDTSDRYHILADISQRRYASEPGERFVAEDIMQSEVLWDATSASIVANRVIATKAILHRVVTVQGPSWLGWLDPGDVVKVTVPELAMAERVALVKAKTWLTPRLVECSLILLEIPARDRRATG